MTPNRPYRRMVQTVPHDHWRHAHEVLQRELNLLAAGTRFSNTAPSSPMQGHLTTRAGLGVNYRALNGHERDGRSR